MVRSEVAASRDNVQVPRRSFELLCSGYATIRVLGIPIFPFAISCLSPKGILVAAHMTMDIYLIESDKFCATRRIVVAKRKGKVLTITSLEILYARVFGQTNFPLRK